MIDTLIKRVSVTYKCYEMYARRGKIVDDDNSRRVFGHLEPGRTLRTGSDK
jgi:hypothetical protein